MKNVRLTTGLGYTPPLTSPLQQPVASFSTPRTQSFSISFSADFENEAESLKFATNLLNMVNGDNE